MSTSSPSLLSQHTLATLCADLVGGGSVIAVDANEPFQLSADASRSALKWLIDHQSKWAGNNTKSDVELLVDALSLIPPLSAAAQLPASTRIRRWRLNSLRAHRFAGLQSFGLPSTPPPLFTASLTNDISIIHGENGTGKTSFVNAIMWCLTGLIARPQRPPEPATLTMTVELAAGSSALAETSASQQYELPAVVPLPGLNVLSALTSARIPVDTWVELDLVDSDSGEQATLRRALRSNASGKVIEDSPNTALLGIGPIALHLGVVMPAQLPYLRLTEASTLGKAVSALTGLSPLSDMCVYVERSIDKLRNGMRRDCEEVIRGYDDEYGSIRLQLGDLLARHSALGDIASIPSLPAASNTESLLSNARLSFANQYAALFDSARSILGDRFDPSNASSTAELAQNVGPALGLLDRRSLLMLHSLKLLSAIALCPDTACVQMASLIDDIKGEADEFALLQNRPEEAKRIRLYGRVGAWLLDDAVQLSNECPVCNRTLDGVADPVTGRPVREHLAESTTPRATLLAQSLRSWFQGIENRMRRCLPQDLGPLLNADAPTSLVGLLSTGLTEELFQSERYSGCLALLKPGTSFAISEETRSLPELTFATPPSLPPYVSELYPQLSELITRATRCIAFVRWRREHEVVWTATFNAILGADVPCLEPSSPAPERQSLRGRLRLLSELVQQGTPLAEATNKVVQLERLVQNRRTKEARIVEYSNAATALTSLLPIRQLVDTQVAALIRRLATGMSLWKDRLYQPASITAPRAVSPNVSPDGILRVQSELAGVRAPADQISNTSDLRATLLAFLISFWQDSTLRHGGLIGLVCDDLQEHFDHTNQDRLARALPEVLENHAQLVVATNSQSFRKKLAANCNPRGNSSISCRCETIHPLNAIRPRIALVPFVETVDEKRRLFESAENENLAQPARDYLNALRIHIEESLKDFFDVADPAISNDSAVGDLIGAVRRRVTAGHEMFTTTPFVSLVSDPAMTQGSEFLRLMNESHHSQAAGIQYSEVHAIAIECKRMRDLVEACHETYERWLRRVPAEVVQRPQSTISPFNVPTRAVPLFRAAALMDGSAFSEDSSSGESLSFASLGNHGLFRIRAPHLGFAAPIGCCVIVDLSPVDIRDGALVIASHDSRTYARRLLRKDSRPDIVMLASESADPRRRAPTLVISTSMVTLLPIRGVIFNCPVTTDRSRDEAVEHTDVSVLDRIRIAFTIDGDSALPLALDGQRILASTRLSLEGSTDIGRLVALSTSDGDALFKRVGRTIPGFGHVRKFESVGGLGESFLARTGEIENDPMGGLPLVLTAVAVEGVLYG